MSDYRDYENGVADVLTYLAGKSAVVERNVKLKGRSGRSRQLDVVVRGRLFGVADTALVVECKRWRSPIDIKDVEAFIGMVEDVGADGGLLVTTVRVTDGAEERAKQERAIHLRVLGLDELERWTPPGTETAIYRLPAQRSGDAQRIFRTAGFRVSPARGYSATSDEVVLGVTRNYGRNKPPPEERRRQVDQCVAELRKIGVDPIHVSTSYTGQGGTPGHRWLRVAVEGVPVGPKVLAATEAEAEHQLDLVCALMPGVLREALSVIRPEGWPLQGFFGS